MGRKRNHAVLTEARGDEAAVHLRRSLEDAEELEGYIVGLSDEWVVIHRLRDLRLDGWSAVRLSTIRNVRRAHHAGVLDAALEYWDERPTDFGARLGSDAELLRSFAERFALVAYFDEASFPDELLVGRIVRITSKKLDVLHVSPGATWEDWAGRLKQTSITRLDAGDDYLLALGYVAGTPSSEALAALGATEPTVPEPTVPETSRRRPSA
jgi:hypothetical protein